MGRRIGEELAGALHCVIAVVRVHEAHGQLADALLRRETRDRLDRAATPQDALLRVEDGDHFVCAGGQRAQQHGIECRERIDIGAQLRDVGVHGAQRSGIALPNVKGR